MSKRNIVITVGAFDRYRRRVSRFRLLSRKMRQESATTPFIYTAKRSAIASIFTPGPQVLLRYKIECWGKCDAVVSISKAGKLRIGCQEFSLEEAAKLRKWAMR